MKDNKTQRVRQTKEMYDKTRKDNVKKKRALIKIARQENDSSRRLYFFEAIIRAMGMNWSSFSRAIGASQQKLSWIVSSSDDCKISFLFSSLDKIGVEITPSFTIKKDSDIIAQGDGFCVKGTLPNVSNSVTSVSYIDECIQKGGRLAFLATFIKESGLTITQFCKKANMDPTSLRFAFEHDDTKVSVIIKIAEQFNRDIEWSVKAKDSR